MRKAKSLRAYEITNEGMRLVDVAKAMNSPGNRAAIASAKKLHAARTQKLRKREEEQARKTG